MVQTRELQEKVRVCVFCAILDLVVGSVSPTPTPNLLEGSGSKPGFWTPWRGQSSSASIQDLVERERIRLPNHDPVFAVGGTLPNLNHGVAEGVRLHP